MKFRIKRTNRYWYIYRGLKSKQLKVLTLNARIQQVIENFYSWFERTTKKSIYYSVWSRDCDMCESTNVGVVYGEKNWNKMIEDVPNWAEGPVSHNRISKDEYETFLTPLIRDRVMEAFENGCGNSIYV